MAAPAGHAASWRGGCCALACGSCAALFLLWRRWSHAWGFRLFGLPTLQQELNLFSENAFYYSFYRQTLEAPSLPEAVRALRHDDRTEHPKVIDALSRFNVLPELLLGTAYRLLPQVAKKQCGRFAFYAGAMLLSNALGSGVLCALAWSAGGDEPACAAAELGLWVAMLLVPISRTIGVHVTALRENFALPVLHWQTALLVSLLRAEAERQPGDAGAGLLGVTAFSAATLLFLLCWQFSGFVLCAQAAAVFGAFLLGRPAARTLVLQLVLAYVAALSVQAALMPGGAAAALSPVPEVLGAIAATVIMRPYARLVRRGGRRDEPHEGLLAAVVHAAYAVAAFLALRSLRGRLMGGELTEHVDELLGEKLSAGLRSAIVPAGRLLQPLWPDAGRQLGALLDGLPTPKPSFDSAVYLGQDEFRALWDEGVLERNVLAGGWCTMVPLGVALGGSLLASALLAASFCTAAAGRDETSAAKKRGDGEVGAVSSAPPPDLVFLAGLAVLYSGLTVLVWRLRVLSLPVLAVLGAQALSPRLWARACPCCLRAGRRAGQRPSAPCPGRLRSLRWGGGLACLALSSCYLGKTNTFYDQGLNPDTEREDRRAQYKMFRWAHRHAGLAPGGDKIVLAGDATTLASARLALPKAAVIAHPHYEHPRARQRFKDGKEFFFACASASDAHDYAVRMGATHVLLDLAKLAPQQAVSLSRFYKKRRRCREGSDLLGMDRTLFQIILDANGRFEPLHAAGSYVLVKVLPEAAAAGPSGGRADPGSPASWAGLLDRCPSREKEESCAEDLGLFVRTLADPMRQHAWVREFAADAGRRYPQSASLQALLGRTFDYDLSDFEEAARHYRRATQLQPGEPHHWSMLGSLLAQVWGKGSADELREVMEAQAPLLLGSPPGPGMRDLAAQRLCQAAAWSRSLGLKSRWEPAFWQTARLRSRFGCMLEQWELMEGKKRSGPELVLDYLLFAD